jgi:hypothetical protein
MRPELIVFVTKAIEPALLLSQVGGRRTRRLGFQDTMHPRALICTMRKRKIETKEALRRMTELSEDMGLYDE